MTKRKNKTDYGRLTFYLSVIGFIGSLGFYIGVLHDLQNSNINTPPCPQKVIIESPPAPDSIQNATIYSP